jgi:4-amino-4-deoxy-L-arabinose transferase-like glycosyltransferase
MGAAGQRPVRILLVLFAVSLVARLLVGVFVLGLDAPPDGDAGAYDQIAYNLMSEGRYIQYHGDNVWLTFRPPLLPYILAGLYSVVGYSFTASRLLMIVIGSTLPLLVFVLADRIFGRRVGILAGVITALWPEFLLYSNTLYTEGLLVPLVVLQFVFLFRFADEGRVGDMCAAGIVAGLGALCRPSVLAILPVVVIWLLIVNRRRLGSSIRAVALYLIFAILVMTPWTLRNYRVHGRFVPIVSRSGATLWYGNNKWATGDIGKDFEMLKEKLPDAGTDDEVEANLYYRDEALRYIKAHPGRFVALGVKKTVNFWLPVGLKFPGLADRLTVRTRIVQGLFTYVPVFLLCIVGLLLLLKNLRLFRDPRLLFLILVLVEYTLVHAVYTGMTRYRQPLEPITIVIASWARLVILDRLRGRQQE